MKILKNHDTKISLITIGGFLALSIFLFYFILMTGLQLPTDKDNYYPLIIPMGSSLSQVADSILTSGVNSSHREITTAGKMLGVDKLIKAGKYNLKAGMRLYEIFDLITSGEVDPVIVTIKEGWNSKRIAKEFSIKLNITKENFMSYLSDSLLISELGIAATHLEGYLYPETYHFSYGMNC